MDDEKKIFDARKYNFNEISFEHLMQKRIYKVLLICSNYDFFMIEEDGRIDEQIFNEYISLSLRKPPVFIHANNVQAAETLLAKKDIDLVITMLSIDKHNVFELSKKIKQTSNIPIVVLTAFSRELTQRFAGVDLSAVDYVFCWLGNTEILLAIIKLIEDKMNLHHDVEIMGVQTILLVEDSIRYYSSFLPLIYKIILKQAREFMTEGLNDHKEMLLMRGRPKILLATNYEDAIAIYRKHRENLLGIISDIAYSLNGVKDDKAGFKLHELICSEDQHIQFVLQSSDLSNEVICRQKNVDFIHKTSKNLNRRLTDIIFKKMAFGDFIFLNPDNMQEIARATDLQSMQKLILEIPESTLKYHFNRNDFSRWLNARALFPVAQMLKYLKLDDFSSLHNARTYIYKTISNYRLNKGRGVISKFIKSKYDNYLNFSRIGAGSIGGKARGLAFIESFLKQNDISSRFNNVVIAIPRTVVISTEIFDEYMNINSLYNVALSTEKTDQEILHHFLNAHLPRRLESELKMFLSISTNPIAVRSSSVLEDSHYQPFAGIYATYMLPRVKSNPQRTLKFLTTAIKSVYASVFYKSSKAYMAATSNLIDEEKMAVILQEVCGKQYDNYFYPHLSGVARSINFYPIPPEKSTDGIAEIGLGLGRMIVEGGVSLRLSPKYPKKIIQLSSPQMALKSTQKYFYAIDLNPDSFTPSIDDSVNIVKLPIKEAEKHKSIDHLASTYDLQNQMIRDGVNYKGRKIITFANILKNNTFPLCEILELLLHQGQNEMNTPVEIEFAANLNTNKKAPQIFNFLQIRPIVENHEEKDVDLSRIKEEDTIIYSKSALGNGIIKNICDFVYVKPNSFHPSKNVEMARIISRINEKFVAENKNYVLVAPGRWGSSDPWLGIPVKWPQISAARLIVEAGLPNFRIDPSQGTHFFQNLTSFNVGYFTINPYIKDGTYNLEYLEQQTAYYEDEYFKHIRFDKPLIIKIDGKNNVGAILKEDL